MRDITLCLAYGGNWSMYSIEMFDLIVVVLSVPVWQIVQANLSCRVYF